MRMVQALRMTPTFEIIKKGEKLVLWTIIVILVILWLLGFLGSNISSRFPKTGSWIHVLIVIAVILIILQLLGVVNL